MRIIALAFGTLTTAAALSLTGAATASAAGPGVTVSECFAGGGIPLHDDCVGGIHDGQPIIWS